LREREALQIVGGESQPVGRRKSADRKGHRLLRHFGESPALRVHRHAGGARGRDRLVHLVEGANPEPGRSPAADFKAINEELALYSATLAKKPQIIAVTKIDIPAAREAGEKFANALAKRKKPVKVHLISAATGEGLDPLLDAVGRALFKEASPRREGHGRRIGKPRRAK
jgi:GTPase involved in cell partitioning and DNA repair